MSEANDEEAYKILPEEYNQIDYCYKVVIIGDSGVGKSCLSLKATQNVFDPSCQTTVGVEFFTLNVEYKSKAIKLQIWDTCGQEIYRSLITSYYKNASLAVIVYAINDRTTYNDVEIWIKELKTYASPDIKIFLIGNKIDLKEERVVQKEEGEKMADGYQLNDFMETSAKDGINAIELFVEGAKILCNETLRIKQMKDSSKDIKDSKSKVILGKENEKESSGCCGGN